MPRIIASALACLLLANVAFAHGLTSDWISIAPEQPSATIALTGRSVAVGVGYVCGHGDLFYQGKRYRFRLSGLSVADVGFSDITASGAVYRLNDLKDFKGNYVALSVGVTLARGGSLGVLKNEHGVVIRLLSVGKGLRLNLSGQAVGMKLQT